MPRIATLEYEQTTGDYRTTFDQGLVKYHRMTNMKRTLLHSIPAYTALMEWYPLFDCIKEFLGERLSVIFSHAISVESDCLLCTTFMRRELILWGEDPSKLVLDEKGEVLVEFGRAIAKQGSRIPDDLFQRVKEHFNTEQIVALTGFASLMIATNIINSVLEVEVDEHLYEFRPA
ncbi:MAG: hypothetical protein WCK35_07950 [Chloroflexota bacterium]